MIDRIEQLYALRVHERLSDFPDELLRRHARRLAARPLSAGALIQEPARYCLLLATDRFLMMVRRQVADLCRRAAVGAVSAQADWTARYQQLLAELGALVSEPCASEAALRDEPLSLVGMHSAPSKWPIDSDVFLVPLIERAEAGMMAVAAAGNAGTLRIDDALHLTPLAAETARMNPQVSAPAVRQAMCWAADERRLAEACGAVLKFMHRHPGRHTATYSAPWAPGVL